MKRLIVAFTMLFWVWPSFAQAQEARIQIGRGPHYLGEPIEIQVVASDFEGDPTPEVEAGEIDGGQLRYSGVSDSSSTSITIVNGRMSRVREVNFVYRYQLIARREGRIQIPPFTVRQGATTRTTRAANLAVASVPTTGLVDIRVELPEGPLFVGQKVPVAIEFEIDREAQQDLLSYQITVPLFDLPTLRFLDEPRPDSDTQLEIETAAGTLRLPASSRERQVGGRTVLQVRAERTMIAISPEAVVAEAPRVVIQRGTRYRRDLFNQRQATASERRMAVGQEVELEVVEVPREGRPPSFAGAVGSGFSFEVSADRSVVQVGEPILLSFHLRGDGDLSTASLPPLGAQGMLDPQQFRIPEDSPAGLVEEDGKHFEASLRVLDEKVNEVPSLAYTWFDAETRRFETTYSRPIALSVGEAELIGADDVARRGGSAPTSSNRTSLSPAHARDRVESGSVETALPGADLAIEPRAERVLRSGSGSIGDGWAVRIALYTLGLAALFYGVFEQRRRGLDPGLVAEAQAWKRAEEKIESALSGSDAPAELGRALREWVASQPEHAGPVVDGLIAECDALRFAPDSGSASLPAPFVERVRAFVVARKASENDPVKKGTV